jgi:uncharacterized protein involved in response to NO
MRQASGGPADPHASVELKSPAAKVTAEISTSRDGAGHRQRGTPGLALFSAGFRPFFLLAALWSAIAVPVWLAAYAHGYVLRGPLHAMAWHAHEMVYGFGLATVCGFLLTAVPNWTGRAPLRGRALGALAALWLAGRLALLASHATGSAVAAAIDLLFPVAFIAVIARELIAGRNWRNMPILAALGLLLAGNVLVHLQAMGIAYTADLGSRLGIGTLLALISLVGGRIVPNFTGNWLTRSRPDIAPPPSFDRIDAVCMAATVAGLAAWAIASESVLTAWLEIVAGTAAAVRLSRWRGLATIGEPLLFVLHAGYAWLALGLALLGLNGLFAWAPAGAPLHALTVGAIGTMTLAVMTRATLGHTGRPLTAGAATLAIYALVTLAAVFRVAAPLSGSGIIVLTLLAGLAWTAAFTLFVFRYGPMLLRPRAG